jgi:tetratricopeptide (TPR) repeat protein
VLRLRRFTQRHPAWSVGVTLGFLLFVATPILFALFQQQKNEQLKVANAAALREARRSQATVEFLTEDLLASVAPNDGGKDVSMREVLDLASQKVAGRFADPKVEAQIRSTIGHTYRLLGVYPAALEHLTTALTLYQEHAGSDHPESLIIADRLASVHWRLGKVETADELWSFSLQTLRQTLGSDHPNTLKVQNNLGLLYAEMGRFKEAEDLLLNTFEKRLQSLGEEHKDALITMGNLGYLYTRMERHEEAHQWIRRNHEIAVRVLGEEHPNSIISLDALAVVLTALGKPFEGLDAMQRCVELAQKTLGSDHPETIRYLLNLASCHQGDPKRAYGILEQAAEAGKKTLGPNHPTVLRTRNNLANCLCDLRRWDDAEELAATTLESCLEALGDEHRYTHETRYVYGRVLEHHEDWEEAALLYEEALESAAGGLTGSMLIVTLHSYARSLWQLARLEEAENTYLRALEEIVASKLGSQQWRSAADRLVSFYENTERAEKALEWQSRIAARAEESSSSTARSATSSP